MASSFNQKSSSSASSSPRPTFRRASGKGTPRVSSSAPRARRSVASGAFGSGPAPAAPGSKPPAGSYAVPSPHKKPRSLAKPPTRKAGAGRVATPTRSTSAPKAPSRRTFTSVAAPARPAAPKPKKRRLGALGAIGGAFALVFGFLAGLLRLIPHPKLPATVRRYALIALAALAVLGVSFAVLAFSPVFSATVIQVQGSEHVSQQEAQALLQVPEGTTLLNVNEAAIAQGLERSPWVSGVSIERTFPHTLVITPVERKVAAIAYIAADDVAWAIGSDETWIAPLSLDVTLGSDGKPISDTTKLATGAQVTQLSGLDAALVLAKQVGAVLLTDVSADVSPSSGAKVESKIVLAGLAYANGFSESFISQVKDLSVPSVEAIAANLDSGVEVLLGSPDNIKTKEQVVTKLLEQEQGVTYINVRTPDSYTFRSADTSN